MSFELEVKFQIRGFTLKEVKKLFVAAHPHIEWRKTETKTEYYFNTLPMYTRLRPLNSGKGLVTRKGHPSADNEMLRAEEEWTVKNFEASKRLYISSTKLDALPITKSYMLTRLPTLQIDKDFHITLGVYQIGSDVYVEFEWKPDGREPTPAITDQLVAWGNKFITDALITNYEPCTESVFKRYILPQIQP